MSGAALIAALPPPEAPPVSRAGRADLWDTLRPVTSQQRFLWPGSPAEIRGVAGSIASPSSAKRNMPQRPASKVDGPQEQRQAVYLIVMFAVRKGGGLALEGREPGGFLGQVYVGGCEGPISTIPYSGFGIRSNSRVNAYGDTQRPSPTAWVNRTGEPLDKMGPCQT